MTQFEAWQRMRRFGNVTRVLAIVSLLLPLGVIGYAARGEVLAIALSGPLTVLVWMLTAAQMRSNLRDRGGYFNDPSDSN